jgi:dGTP triphosphohydrolase
MENSQRKKAASLFQKKFAYQRYSLHDPEYNYREIVKQMLLVEEHLANPSKNCQDCVSKHLMSIEALADESFQLASLDAHAKVSEILRECALRWIEEVDWTFQDVSKNLALKNKIREVRKDLMPFVVVPGRK